MATISTSNKSDNVNASENDNTSYSANKRSESVNTRGDIVNRSKTADASDSSSNVNIPT